MGKQKKLILGVILGLMIFGELGRAESPGIHDGTYSYNDAAQDNYLDALALSGSAAAAGGLTVVFDHLNTAQLRPAREAMMDSVSRTYHPQDIRQINEARMSAFRAWRQMPEESRLGPAFRVIRNASGAITILLTAGAIERAALGYYYESRDRGSSQVAVICLSQVRPEHAAYRCEDTSFATRILNGAAYESQARPQDPVSAVRSLAGN